MPFCHDIKICRNFCTFWVTLDIKVLLWARNSVSWARSALLHGTYCISCWIKFANLQLCAKITHLSRKYAPDGNFCGHFCPCRKAATSATLPVGRSFWTVRHSCLSLIWESVHFAKTNVDCLSVTQHDSFSTLADSLRLSWRWRVFHELGFSHSQNLFAEPYIDKMALLEIYADSLMCKIYVT